MIKIGNREIGRHTKPFIIAEMSGNHNQSLERALHLVELAAEAGVDALKLQTYTPDTITLDVHTGEFFIQEDGNLWRGNSLYNLYKEAYTPWEWHKEIFAKAQELGLLAFSSPFDETAVDFLETLNVPAYKIASFENVDIPLIKKVARTGKPMIISTGMATAAELDEAVRAAREEGNNQIILLKCTSTYPATPANSNLVTIPHLKEMFSTEVGLSDHTMGVGVSVTAVALGATVIEKHFTTSRAEGGVDSAFSMEPHELKMLVEETERAWQSLGNVSYGPTNAEKESAKFRRSLYIGSDLKAGDILTEQNVRNVRPGLGLPTKYYDLVIGKSIKHDVKKGTPLSWDLLL
ncbi:MULTISPECIES: pseudaminic acid synthase [Lysinibacillus]|uniref:Pseudaminic acid synthase n=1 Tax=Lysinibacillus fusiformis TaxID=28031 RepID=A0A2I0V5W2_9BACI|nr:MULTISPECIES: pseudaminic acid synthase [Lysinibacillus]PKU53612.1 pseudaminic acid synthase [Lysinibacillus fusiformis]SCZ07995.1 SAF domain-containing protein [Lysinibacillus sp. SG9]SDB52860.1 SAF domain-containing protein [Lysinibacillus sp. TC-37]SFT17091.1 SAF domain-containing protein [Lysinibacillus sp. SG55]